MDYRRASRGRLAVATGALLAAAAIWAAGAPAEHQVLEHASTGPTGGNARFPAESNGASADGRDVYFRTDERLVAADVDTTLDVYERSGGQTALVSTGPADPGAGAQGADFAGASADGSRAFFTTPVALLGEDDDVQNDLYERSGGSTALVSTGAAGNGPSPPIFLGASADGTRVFFTTTDALEDADGDAAQDIYERSGGSTALVSTGPTDPGGGMMWFVGASADGTRVYFETFAQLVDGDEDASFDLYRRAGGQTRLVSTGPTESDEEIDVSSGSTSVRLSADGTVAAFETTEQLVEADDDTAQDVYVRSGGETTLVSTGSDDAYLISVSDSGTHVIFGTSEPLLSDDADASFDLYSHAGGLTTLVSTGPADDGAFDVIFGHISADGGRVVFETFEPLVEADTDARMDLYERAGGQTTLLSTGPADHDPFYDPYFAAASADGRRVFFMTGDSLVAEDTDGFEDVYERAGGVTTLLSTGPEGGNAPVAAGLGAVSDDGTRVIFTTPESLMSSDTDEEWDVYVRRIAPPESTAPPVISGTPAAGRALSCSTGTWSNVPTRFTYRWNRDGAAIPGATAGSHLVTPADAGRRLTCTVTASNSGGATSATSAPVTIASIAPPPPPGDDETACATLKTGGKGNDRLTGTRGGDRLRGRGGDDILRGLAGDDCLSGANGKDKLRAGRGDDKLTGGTGKDELDAGAGDDTVKARDNRRETVRCGKGTDRVTADRDDKLIGCETVKRR